MIVITQARTLADFHETRALIAEMGEWDVAQCDAHGLPSEEVISAYYSANAVSLWESCTIPSARMHLAWLGSVAVGCIGHTSHGDAAEITKFFVRPEGRGKGVGTRLLATALDSIRCLEFQKVNLVTISFMTDAITLYGKFGFQECEPFQPAPKGLEEATRYMEMVIR